MPIKLRRRPPRRQPEPRDSVDPKTLRQLGGKWVAWASSDGANYEIIASGAELGDVLDEVFQLGLGSGVTYQRLPDSDDRLDRGRPIGCRGRPIGSGDSLSHHAGRTEIRIQCSKEEPSSLSDGLTLLPPPLGIIL
jgi:hypothetical protein